MPPEQLVEDSRRKIPVLQLGEPVLSPTEIWALEVPQGPGPFQESGTTCPWGGWDTLVELGSASAGSQRCTAVLGSELPRDETLVVEGVCGTMSRLSIKR
jgi:hypothetical protein